MYSHFYKIIFLLLLAVSSQLTFATETIFPGLKLLYAPAEVYAISPQLSPDGKTVLFSDSSETGLWIVPIEGGKPSRVASGHGIGRRFLFEPGQERVVFKQVVMALQEKPERLFSTSLYLYDPISRTSNLNGKLYGPYNINHKIFYRTSLDAPLTDYSNKSLVEGPYLELATGKLWILNQKGDTVFVSKEGEKFSAMEIAPDGENVAAMMEAPATSLLIINCQTGKIKSLGQGVWPSWSGNGKKLVYLVKPFEIWVCNTVNDQAYSFFANVNYNSETPALDENGKKVLFISNGGIYEFSPPQEKPE